MKKATRIFALLLSLICLLALTVPAFAAGNVIDKVLIRLSSPPVVMMDSGTVRASTDTVGCSLASMTWYDVNSQPITGAFTNSAATLVLTIAGYGGYGFSESTKAYINNEAVACTVGDGGATLTLTRQYMPSVWAPTVNKHPGADKVDEGGTVSFVATANYADQSVWKVLDQNGQLWTLDQLAMAYPNFNYHDSFGKLIMNNVPRELDGAEFCCTFIGAGGAVDSNWATLKVNYTVVETPAPTPEPTPTPTPAATPEPTPVPTPKAEAHTHEFSSDWKFDDSIHWHECACGEQKDFAPHSFQWETVEKATRKAPGKEKGTCSVCGCEKEEELAYEGFSLSGLGLGENTIRIIVLAAAGFLLLVGVLILVLKIKQKKERERRRKEALRRKRERERRERGE